MTMKLKKNSAPFDVRAFTRENKDLIKKYKRKDTSTLDVPDFEDVSSDWLYQGNENLLRGRLDLNSHFTLLQKLEWIKCCDDIIYFVEKYIKIISVDDGIVPFKMYDYQAKLIKSFNDNRFNIACQCRQSGKCVEKNTKYTIRNKKTGEVIYVTAEEFHEMQSKRSNV